MAKSWDQLFRTQTERLWFAPPPIDVVTPKERNRIGPQYAKFNDLEKRVSPKDKDKNKGPKGPHDKHGPKHRPKHWDNRNMNGGKNKRGKN